MKRTVMIASVLIIAVLALAGCGGESSSQAGASTPQKAWSHYVSAMKTGSASEFYSLLSSAYLGNTGSESQTDVLKKWNATVAAPGTYDKVKLLSVNQSGTTATVKFTFEGNPDYTGQIVLVKENGTWKLAAGTGMKKL